jgi:mannonate dehydratase
MKKAPFFSLEQCMRWYGPSDPVSLVDIRQAGCTGVVSALHTVPVGEVWTSEAIQSYKAQITAHQLDWKVVESLPVHEAIKAQSDNFELYIENYKQSLQNLAENGIEVVTYNFMPVLDWLRTDTAHLLSDGAQTLSFNKMDYAIFDLYILERPNAAKGYSPQLVNAAKVELGNMPEAKLARLKESILMALPGSDEAFTFSRILNLLEIYQNIDSNQLKQNLIYFLKAITPIAEEAGIQLAIHPDDPPFSILGLPRIMSTEEDISDIIEAVPSPANGLCFCTGSLGARPDNDLPRMIQKWGNRIHFLHLRNTQRDEKGNFMEAPHLGGDTNMYDVMQEVVQLMQQEQRSIPMRPDHGYKMLDDLKKSTYPGYTAIGRLKGLAELRGLEYGIREAMFRT